MKKKYKTLMQRVIDNTMRKNSLREALCGYIQASGLKRLDEIASYIVETDVEGSKKE